MSKGISPELAERIALKQAAWALQVSQKTSEIETLISDRDAGLQKTLTEAAYKEVAKLSLPENHVPGNPQSLDDYLGLGYARETGIQPEIPRTLPLIAAALGNFDASAMRGRLSQLERVSTRCAVSKVYAKVLRDILQNFKIRPPGGDETDGSRDATVLVFKTEKDSSPP